jgi:DeoR/GlpR family transcriptional regulator of sugar metabolism
MLTAERRQVILEQLRRDGKVIAVELSAALAVSPDTVRRDLQELATRPRRRAASGIGRSPLRGAA